MFEIIGEYTTSLKRALKEIDRDYEKYDALVVAGTHNPKDYDIEKIIDKIRDARDLERPTLLICWGHQLGAIEYARNILGIKHATSEEWGDNPPFVVKKRKTLKVGLHEGQSYWNNYEVVIDWERPENFFSSQAHVEYDSSIDRPSPILIQFINYAKMASKN